MADISKSASSLLRPDDEEEKQPEEISLSLSLLVGTHDHVDKRVRMYE